MSMLSLVATGTPKIQRWIGIQLIGDTDTSLCIKAAHHCGNHNYKAKFASPAVRANT
jgi:hypothetical protein